MDKRWVAALCFALTSLALFFFSSATSLTTWVLVPFLVLFGLGWGGNVIMRVALLRENFGLKKFGTAYGFVAGAAHLGGLPGPPLAGWVFDKRGSYQGIWFIFAFLAVVSMVIILTTPRFKNKTEPADINRQNTA